MLNYKNLNILFFLLLAAIIALDIFLGIGFIPYLILIISYLTILITGIFRIRMNFFITSLNYGKTDKKEIALTFDDGPHPEVTPKVLELLKTHGVKVAFFCIGKKAEQYPEIITSVVKDKHIIGNHSYSHNLLFDFFTPAKMVKDLNKTTKIIFRATGKKVRLFRPPFGVTNPLLKKTMKRTALISTGWTIRSLDTVKSPEKVLDKLKKQTRPGAIILLHDSHEKIIPILGGFLPWLQEKDYHVVRLDELLNIQAYEHD